MTIATVSANLFRIAYSCVSDEETRYYLQGVYIQPAHTPAGGVLMTSTDGHRLICVHDAYGSVDVPSIVKIPPDVLKACKPSKKDVGERFLTIVGDTATIIDRVAPKGEPPADLRLAVADRVLIDGTFPDWQQVLPRIGAQETTAAFAPKYVASFAKIGQELDAPSMSITSWDVGAPALIRWPGRENVFGVLMPMRAPAVDAYPAFMGIAEGTKAAA